MQNTNPTTNVLQEYAPFDSGYEFAYWSKKLNNLNPFDPNYFHYRKSVMHLGYYIQIGRVLRAHLEFAKSKTSNHTLQAYIIISLACRMEGEYIPAQFFDRMPLDVFESFFDQLI